MAIRLPAGLWLTSILAVIYWLRLNDKLMNRSIKSKIIALAILLLLLNCENNEKHERGFILFIDPEHWYFVPSKENSNFCLQDFRTENVKAATQFRPFFT